MYNHIFIIGAPRSGTSWLHKLIGSHPKVASSVEINFFHKYLRPVLNAWEHEVKINETGQWEIGLPVLFSESERDKFILEVLSALYGRIAQTNHRCTHILDKHPANTFEIDNIRKYVPNAKFIHIVRDGRKVAHSLVRIRREMGQMFGSASLDNAAWQWRKYVEEAVKYRGQPWYLEIRYEDLLSNGEEVLMKLFQFCGLDADEKEVTGIVSKWEFEKMQNSDEEYFKDSHFGENPVAGTSEYAPLEAYCLNKVQGEMLQSLGYVSSNDWWAKTFLQRTFIPLRHRILLLLKRHPFIN